MRIVVFGAAGPTGVHLTRRALERGFEVTAVTRRVTEFPVKDEQLRVVRADATDPVGVAEAIKGADAVLSVLGTKFSPKPITVYSASAKVIVSEMRRQGLTRLVVTSSSATEPWVDPSWSWLERTVAFRVLGKLGAPSTPTCDGWRPSFGGVIWNGPS